jgi:hypothetical protein
VSRKTGPWGREDKDERRLAGTRYLPGTSTGVRAAVRKMLDRVFTYNNYLVPTYSAFVVDIRMIFAEVLAEALL